MFAPLARVSPGTYHLTNPNQPEDICVYEAGQLLQCLTFDAHLRSIHEPIRSILAPAGYKELSDLFNAAHSGPERFCTFERQQDGSVRVHNHGPPVTSELLGVESIASLDGADIEGVGGRDSQNEGPDDVDAFVMVDMPGSANLEHPALGQIDKVTELARELSKFYIARAQVEEEYASSLFRLRDLISARHQETSSGNLQASFLALLQETDTQAVTHQKLSTDIKKEVVDILEARLAASRTELDQITSLPGNSTLGAYQQPDFRTRCVKLQETNLNRIKEVMWAQANHVSVACVADDEASEVVRLALEKLVPVDEAARLFPTSPGTPVSPPTPVPEPVAGSSSSQGSSSPQSRPVTPPRYLFQVRARFDYTPQDPEDLHLQEGDIIGVRTIADDGWWKGELLTGPRRGAVGMVPSNFVTTQNVTVDI